MKDYDVIVSLTTWKGRINDDKVYKVIFRLLKQQVTSFKYKVVLVLSREEFGDDYVLPEPLALMERFEPNFEILWTDKNTKALKKLDPTMAKYPELPIITIDDDDLLKPNAIDMMMQAHIGYPDAILGTICGNYFFDVCRVAGVRLFPPHSLADLPYEDFVKYFDGLHDDEWNGIRAKAKGTRMLKVADKLIENSMYGDQQVAFRKEYNKFNFKAAYDKYRKDHAQR